MIERPPIALSDEEIDFILDWLEPGLGDEEEGRQVFTIMRKLYDMKIKKDSINYT